MKYCLLILMLLLAACGSADKLAKAKGPFFPLNVGHWQPAPSDLQLTNDGRQK